MRYLLLLALLARTTHGEMTHKQRPGNLSTQDLGGKTADTVPPAEGTGPGQTFEQLAARFLGPQMASQLMEQLQKIKKGRQETEEFIQELEKQIP